MFGTTYIIMIHPPDWSGTVMPELLIVTTLTAEEGVLDVYSVPRRLHASFWYQYYSNRGAA